MYIPEFWCGVITTVITEVVVLIIAVAWLLKK
jgi:hypothetical protein